MKKIISQPFQIFIQLIFLINISFALLSQDTLYDYQNKTIYLRLRDNNDNDTGSNLNTIFKIPFNSQFTSGDFLSSTISPPSDDRCDVVVANSILYSFCPPKDDEYLVVNKYLSESDKWEKINLNSTIKYYNESTYLFTDSDDEGIYIFSGVSTSNSKVSISNQMKRLDLNSWTFTNATTQVQPSPFYHTTTVQVNANTIALFGGITSNNNYVSMMEIPVWQYNSWAERPCTIPNANQVESRINAIVLPVFYQTNEFLSNQNITNFQVSSLFLLAGKGIDNAKVNPELASLNVSTNIWQWSDLSDKLSSANINNLQNNQTELDINSIDGAIMIYDTLVTFTNNTKSLAKRSDDNNNENDNGFAIQLYNATDLSYVSKVDYTYLDFVTSPKIITVHSNKNLTIALSVIIPVLVIIIMACVLTWMYKKYQKRKEEEQNEKEIKEIVDFYELQHKYSDYTFTSLDSDYKSNHSDNTDFTYIDYSSNNEKDSDDVSLNSWKRKRQQYEQQKYLFNLIRPSLDVKNKAGSNSLIRSLSVASNYISDSLKRKNSTQSSFATFVTAKTNLEENEKSMKQDENPFTDEMYTNSAEDKCMPLPPPPAVPKHASILTFPNRTNSTLNHIPENYSLSTFQSQNLGYVPLKSPNRANNIQQTYMKLINSSPSSNGTSSSGAYSLNSGYSKRPISMISSSTISEKLNLFNNYLLPEESSDVGTINENDMKNIDVQVLVSSKRRSKLRVVNPDFLPTENDEILNSDNDHESETTINGEFDDGQGVDTSEKSRCTSSSSDYNQYNQQPDLSYDLNNVRKRVISDENHDQSFIEVEQND